MPIMKTAPESSGADGKGAFPHRRDGTTKGLQKCRRGVT